MAKKKKTAAPQSLPNTVVVGYLSTGNRARITYLPGGYVTYERQPYLSPFDGSPTHYEPQTLPADGLAWVIDQLKRNPATWEE